MWERTFEGYVSGWFANLLVLKRKDAILEDGSTTLDRMIKAAKELFSSGHFLWHANKAVTESPFDRTSSAE
jgi:hypothetical protein